MERVADGIVITVVMGCLTAFIVASGSVSPAQASEPVESQQPQVVARKANYNVADHAPPPEPEIAPLDIPEPVSYLPKYEHRIVSSAEVARLRKTKRHHFHEISPNVLKAGRSTLYKQADGSWRAEWLSKP